MFTGNDRFTAPALIGRGGMGLVYRTRDEEMACDVAVKTFKVPSPDQLVRLKSEFRSLAEISHRNLLGLYELFIDRDDCFFSMELVQGGVDFTAWVTRLRVDRAVVSTATRTGDLPQPTDSSQPTLSVAYEDALAAKPTLPVPKGGEANGKIIKNPFESRIDLMRLKNATFQLAQGVLALHAAGKLHRDLKPSNVLVTPDGRVVILDFGLVGTIETDEIDGDRRIIGTFQFMSPEQGWGEKLTPASDWYSVGVMLFEALAGKLPFEGTPLQVLYAKRRGPERRLRDYATGVPLALESLVMGLLDPDPVRRLGGDEVLAWASQIDPAGLFSPDEDSAEPGRERFIPRPSASLTPSGLLSVLPFLGREVEMGRLTESLDSAVRGPVVVHVRGVSGMGKSELVRRWLSLLRGRGDVTAFAGRCNPQELIPYKAFDGLIDELWERLRKLPAEQCARLAPRRASDLIRLFPVLASLPGFRDDDPDTSLRPDPHEARRRGFAAFRELAANLARRAPLVLWMDDVQWGDLDSLRMLGALVGGVDPPCVCVVLSYRAEDVSSSFVLDRLLSETEPLYDTSMTRTIDIEALTTAQSKALLRQLSDLHGVRWGAHFDGVIDEAGGSPFFLAEFVRAVAAAAEVGVDAPPTGLSDLVIQRFMHLDTTDRSVLELVAVAGQPVDRSVLLLAAGLGEGGRPIVGSLGKQYFLRTVQTGDRRAVETYHDRIREAIVAQMGPGQSAVRHHQLAHAMLKAGSDDAHALVRHLTGAGHPGQAAAYAVQAAERATEALAFAQAVRLYETALELNDEPAAVARLRIGLAEALANSGRGADAGRAFELAVSAKIAAEPTADPLELRSRAAQQYLQSGQLHDGMRILGEVLAAVGVSLPQSTTAKLASVAWNRARLALRGTQFEVRPDDVIPAAARRRMDVRFVAASGLSLVDLQLNLAFHTQHLIDALNAGARRNIIVGFGTEAAFQAALNGEAARPRCEELLGTAARLASESGEVELQAWAAFGQGTTAYMFADWRATYDACRHAADVFRESCNGVAWEQVSSESYVATALAHMGRLGELSQFLPSILDSARQRGDLYAETSLRMGMPSLKWLADDRGEFALEQANDAIARWPAETFHLQHYLHFLATGHAELYLDRGGDAWRRVERVWPDLERNGYLRLAAPSAELLYLRGRAALAAGGSSARKRVKRCVDALGKRDAASAPAYAAVLAAGMAEVSGDLPGAIASMVRAVSAFEGAAMALHGAGARARLAGWTAAPDPAAWALFAAQGVVNPPRLTAALVGGRATPE